MDRWQRIKEVFAGAFDRPLESRAAFLDEACGDNLEMRREVESLLAAEQEAGRFLSSAVLSPATELELTGQQIGPYRLLAKAGQGGMGVVYEAEDPIGAPGGAEAPAGEPRRQRRRANPFRARGPGRLRPQPPSHLHGARVGEHDRQALPRHGADAGKR